MAHPYHHSLSSVAKWGGKVGDYVLIHSWFDESKQIIADFRHRALRHHAEGVFMAEKLFGTTVTLSTGRVIPVRWIGEQHVQEDLGFIPSFADWVKAIRPERWMGRAQKLVSESLNHQPQEVTAMKHTVNTLLHADCLEALPSIPPASIDFILTDPPYLVNYRSRDGRTVPNDNDDRNINTQTALKAAAAELIAVLGAHAQ